jgi:hypothetical protein
MYVDLRVCVACLLVAMLTLDGWFAQAPHELVSTMLEIAKVVNAEQTLFFQIDPHARGPFGSW